MDLLWNILTILVVLFILVNTLAFRHAWKMTHFVESGQKTPAMEELGLLGKAWLLINGIKVVKKQNQTTPKSEGLSYETLHIETRPGVTLELWRIPKKNARGVILMFPGYTDPKDIMLPEAREFSDMGLECYLVDLPAAGGSTGTVTTIGWKEAKDIAALSRRLKTDGVPMILYGKSMGASAILRAIGRYHAQAEGLILECPFDILDHAVANRFAIMGVPRWPLGHLITFWGEQIMGVSPPGYSPKRYARRVRVPALHIFGQHDKRVTPSQSQSVFRALAGEKHKVMFPESGHTRFLDDNPARWLRSVRTFLNRVCERSKV